MIGKQQPNFQVLAVDPVAQVRFLAQRGLGQQIFGYSVAEQGPPTCTRRRRAANRLDANSLQAGESVLSGSPHSRHRPWDILVFILGGRWSGPAGF